MLPPAGARSVGRRGGGLRLVGDGQDEAAAVEVSRPVARARQDAPRAGATPPAGAGARSRAPGPRGALDGEETERARQLCLAELDRAPRTRMELAALLAGKEVAPDVAEAILDRFTEVGLVDDAAFAQTWVASRHRHKGLARGTLSQELRRKGIDDEVVAEAVAEIDQDDELVAARALIERKRHATRGLDPQVRTRRLVGLLARKGYPAGVAFQVVRDALANEGIEADGGSAQLDD